MNSHSHSSRTTVHLKGLSQFMDRATLEDVLKEEGKMMNVSFIHLPFDAEKDQALGWAILEFTCHEEADGFIHEFNTNIRASHECTVNGEALWSTAACQGLAALIAKYRNSSVMRLPPKVHPAIFEEGVHVPFPSPTEKLRNIGRRKLRFKKSHLEAQTRPGSQMATRPETVSLSMIEGNVSDSLACRVSCCNSAERKYMPFFVGI